MSEIMRERDEIAEEVPGSSGECCRGGLDPLQVGVRFEAQDVEQFTGALQMAREAVRELAGETERAAEAMEQLSRAGKAARRVLYRPWWTSGFACIAAGGWLVLLASLVGLVAGAGRVLALAVAGVLGLATGILAGSVAAGSRRKERI